MPAERRKLAEHRCAAVPLQRARPGRARRAGGPACVVGCRHGPSPSASTDLYTSSSVRSNDCDGTPCSTNIASASRRFSAATADERSAGAASTRACPASSQDGCRPGSICPAKAFVQSTTSGPSAFARSSQAWRRALVRARAATALAPLPPWCGRLRPSVGITGATRSAGRMKAVRSPQSTRMGPELRVAGCPSSDGAAPRLRLGSANGSAARSKARPVQRAVPHRCRRRRIRTRWRRTPCTLGRLRSRTIEAEADWQPAHHRGPLRQTTRCRGQQGLRRTA